LFVFALRIVNLIHMIKRTLLFDHAGLDVATFDDMPDHHLDLAFAILAGVRLRALGISRGGLPAQAPSALAKSATACRCASRPRPERPCCAVETR
jgi:hypothetical protein